MRAIGASIVLMFGVVSVVSSAEQGAAGAGAASAPAVNTDLSGTYWATEYYPKLQPIGGGEPPLSAAGKAAYEQNRAGLRDHSLSDPTRHYCLPDAVPRLLTSPYPFQVYQLPPGQVTFVHELNNQVRVIPLGVQLPPLEQTVNAPAYEGFETGTYEANGSVLVIRSRGFTDQTFLDSSGLPHSPRLETLERVRRIGNQLEDIITIHDPEYYTKDWQVRFVYERRPGLRLQEYVCGEPHRDISQVKGVSEVRALRAKGQFP